MNFIAKHLSLIGILLLTVFVGAAAGLYFDVPNRIQSKLGNASQASSPTCGNHGASLIRDSGDKMPPEPADKMSAPRYTCPMHPDVVQDHPGDCPKCGMGLVPAGQGKSAHDQCAHTGQNQSGCCADKNAVQAAAELKLPPGHPPVPGWTIDGSPENEPASTNTAPHSSH